MHNHHLPPSLIKKTSQQTIYSQTSHSPSIAPRNVLHPFYQTHPSRQAHPPVREVSQMIPVSRLQTRVSMRDWTLSCRERRRENTSRMRLKEFTHCSQSHQFLQISININYIIFQLFYRLYFFIKYSIIYT